MALYLVATPIGHKDDISLRGLEILKRVTTIILEERKEGTAFLRSHGIKEKNYLQLNEHSTKEDLEDLAEVCRKQDVALITDCGTPGFADPGADLVRLCRKQKTQVVSIPGPSSLMLLLSLSGRKIEQFIFRGFLSAENEMRKKQWLELKKEKRAIILMDTPYRLEKMVSELNEYLPERYCLLTINLTQETEAVLEGKPKEIKDQLKHKKAEFMLLIEPL
jgi:16S rRNA (cytidine1402-2'-O)-methyltransferase